MIYAFILFIALLRSSSVAQTVTPTVPAAPDFSDSASTVTVTGFGAAGDGIRDDTAAFQLALNSAGTKTIRIPKPSVKYKVRPLFVKSDTRIVFEPGAIVEAASGYKSTERLITILDQSRVEILGHGAILRMLKSEYSSGEYRHCIAIEGSTNVHITGISCNDSGGDGFLIDGGDRKSFSENVVIKYCTAKGNRRQGMSILSARNLWVINSTFSDTIGAAPEDGIDIEPYKPTAYLDGIQLIGNVTSGNRGHGLQITLRALTAQSLPVNISVKNHADISPRLNGFYASNETAIPVRGTINIDDFSTTAAGAYGVSAEYWNANGPSLTLRELKVVDANQRSATSGAVAVAIRRGGGGVGFIGNVHFVHPTILDTSGKLDRYGLFYDYSNIGLINCTFSTPALFGARNPYSASDRYAAEYYLLTP